MKDSNFKNYLISTHASCEIAIRNRQTFEVLNRVKVLGEFLTACFVPSGLNYYLANSSCGIQNICLSVSSNVKEITNTENQVFYFHESHVVDIIVKIQESSQRCYMISLDKTSICAIWDCNRS